MSSARFRELYLSAGPLPIIGLLAAVLAVVFGVTRVLDTPSYPLVSTVADLEVVQAGVEANGEPLVGVRRLAAGERVATDGDGRARLRLDDGTSFILDRGTRIELKVAALRLEQGRLFVRGAPGAKTEVKAGE